jgi:hypothetical protein
LNPETDNSLLLGELSGRHVSFLFQETSHAPECHDFDVCVVGGSDYHQVCRFSSDRSCTWPGLAIIIIDSIFGFSQTSGDISARPGTRVFQNYYQLLNQIAVSVD